MESNRIMKIMIKIQIILLSFVTSVFGQFQFQREIIPVDINKTVRFSALTVSQFGDIYLIETEGHEVYRLNSEGNVLNVNGGYGWGEARFDTPMDLSMASGLNLFVADYNNHRLVRFDRELNYLTTYPDPNSDYDLSFPRSVVATNLGEIFILRDENAEILRLNVNRGDLMKFGGVEYGDYALRNPVLMRINRAGLINVLEENGRILQFDRFGTPVRRLKTPNEFGVLGMTPVENDIIVLLKKSAGLMLYSSKSENWSLLPITILQEQGRPVSIYYRNDHLYILTDKNHIVVFKRIPARD